MADIDSAIPPEFSFSASYPLPFRVLFLSFCTLLGFATNLHLLAFLGIDTALVLDIRLDDYHRHGTSSTQPPLPVSNSAATSSLSRGGAGTGTGGEARSAVPYVHPSRLYPPIYSLAAIGLAWTAFGWLVFARLTGGVPEAMVRWRAVPAATAICVGAAAVAPWNILFRRERMMFLRSLRRTILSPLYSAVPFSDIILADILTSSAKVLGDVWVSGCLLFTVTERFGMGGNDSGASCARVFMVPVMTSLPYLFRFRQCLSEVVTGSTPTPRRSLLNALKYATAFPVIILSAMQTVLGDPFDTDGKADDAWISRGNLFNLWILAVLVNSLYSFWWDVTNDWGLSLLTKAGWTATPTSYNFVASPQPNTSRNRQTSSNSLAAHVRARSALSLAVPGSVIPPSANGDASSLDISCSSNGGGGVDYPPPPSRPMSPSPTLGPSPKSSPYRPRAGGHMRAYSTAQNPNTAFPYLRPILLLPDPTIYYLAIAIDLVLRLTWSLKLSSHLHDIHEIESGIFLMEALEVVRRWMWVYLRIEWEAVRKGVGGLVADQRELDGRLRSEDEYRDFVGGSNVVVGDGDAHVGEVGDEEGSIGMVKMDHHAVGLPNGKH